MVGEGTLEALALRERAESNIARGDLDSARQDLDAVRELRGFVPNSIDDAEDLRVVALLRAAEGDIAAAERALREVIQRAEMHRRPQLHSRASRDLATVLRRAGRHAEEVPIDPTPGTKRPCGDELHIGLQSSSLAPSMA